MKKPLSRKTHPIPLAIETLVEKEPPVSMIHCIICGSDTHTGSIENMCWVCRRLKISAWREIEQQIPVQE